VKKSTIEEKVGKEIRKLRTKEGAKWTKNKGEEQHVTNLNIR